MKILIAEDDFASRKFIMNHMSKYGECDGTVDGQEAVEAYVMATEDDEPYDLVCLDVMMPEMDGYQVLKTIREIEKDKGLSPKEQVKIIMMTALSAEKNVKMAFELGATVYCAKPVDVDKLQTAMKKLGLIK
ncbi:MAG: response regulator [Lachnospiraceae bacterium]|nr:response regulator [Lachnospiraceae bacterium]